MKFTMREKSFEHPSVEAPLCHFFFFRAPLPKKPLQGQGGKKEFANQIPSEKTWKEVLHQCPPIHTMILLPFLMNSTRLFPPTPPKRATNYKRPKNNHPRPQTTSDPKQPPRK